MKYIIGTRGSKLALYQAQKVKALLAAACPGDTFELQIVTTKGDVVTDRPLDQIGGSGVFVKEIEKKLLSGEIQLAVHSMKDMPREQPEGLVLMPIGEREDPRDVLVLREKSSLAELPSGAVIATGSSRRKCQLLALRPDLTIVGIRGNVETRIRKMHEQQLDGIVLAAAGMKRLGLEDQITQYFEPEEMIPAPTQGILAVELRADDTVLYEKLRKAHTMDMSSPQIHTDINTVDTDTVDTNTVDTNTVDTNTANSNTADTGTADTTDTADQSKDFVFAQTAAERLFLEEMEADCHQPIGAYLTREEDHDLFYALYGKTDGDRTLHVLCESACVKKIIDDENGTGGKDNACCKDHINGKDDAGRENSNGEQLPEKISVKIPEIISAKIHETVSGTNEFRRIKCTTDDPMQLVRTAAAAIRHEIGGKVLLVGAGSGDPGLITVKGRGALIHADCILYDRLIAPELLQLARPDCECIYVGKANSHHTLPQEKINALLLEKAMQYNCVVRLKGGDPYVFGRGGEEALYLTEHGIRCEVIPGVTAAMAALAYAGIPITHRGMAQGFRAVTAHAGGKPACAAAMHHQIHESSNGAFGIPELDASAYAEADVHSNQEAQIDYAGMAAGTDTCVFYMGLSELPKIAQGLIEAGKPADTPAAVISHGTTAEQRTCVGTLSDIADIVTEAGLTSPAIIVVGDTVSLHEQLNFFEQQPLFGKKYLVAEIDSGMMTRETNTCWKNSDNYPVDKLENKGKVCKTNQLFFNDRQPIRKEWISRNQYESLGSLSEQLKSCGAQVDRVVTGRIERIAVSLTAEFLRSYDWILFTSKNGVIAFFENLWENGLDVRCLAQAKIACIGPSTAAALEDYHIHADYISQGKNGKAFGNEMAAIFLRDNKKAAMEMTTISNHDSKTVEMGMREILNCDVKAHETQVLYPQNRADRHPLTDALDGACELTELPVYENVLPDMKSEDIKTVNLKSEDIKAVDSNLTIESGNQTVLLSYDGICFTNTSSVKRFLGNCSKEFLQQLSNAGTLYAIGPETAQAIKNMGCESVHMASEPSYEGMIRCIKLNLLDRK